MIHNAKTNSAFSWFSSSSSILYIIYFLFAIARNSIENEAEASGNQKRTNSQHIRHKSRGSMISHFVGVCVCVCVFFRHRNSFGTYSYLNPVVVAAAGEFFFYIHAVGCFLLHLHLGRGCVMFWCVVCVRVCVCAWERQKLRKRNKALNYRK